MAVEALRALIPISILVVIFAIVMGVVFQTKAELARAGFTWPSSLDTALNTVVSFGSVVVLVVLGVLVIWAITSILWGGGGGGR